MFPATSLIPELEHVLQHGSREKRADALRRITSLFVDGAATPGSIRSRGSCAEAVFSV